MFVVQLHIDVYDVEAAKVFVWYERWLFEL